MSTNEIQTDWPLQKPQQLVYVELGPDNGGMVLGICEQGLSFRAVAPLKTEGPVYFTFALDGKTRLNGAGEIVWSEESGKSGGLKFTNTSEQFRESLRSWLASEATPKAVGREVTPAVALSLDSLSTPEQGTRSADANKVEEAKPAAAPAGPIETKPAAPQPLVPAPEVTGSTTPASIEPPKTELVKPIETPRAEPIVPEPELRTVAPLPAETHSQNEPTFSLPNFRLPSAEVAVPAPPEKLAAPEPYATKPELIAEVEPPPEATLRSTATVSPHVEEPEPRRLIPAPVKPEPWELPEAQETFEEDVAQESPRMNRAFASGIVGIAMAVLVAALVLSFRRDVGEMLIRVGEALSGEERNQVVPQQSPQTVPAQNSSQQTVNGNPPATNPSNENSISTNSTSANSVPADTASPNAVVQVQDLPAPKDGGSGQKEFDQARNMLKGNHRQRDLRPAVDLLWTGVAKGYAPAQVTLADLYARGDGVSKSCAQARVLLQAAIQKGSPEARRRLDQLKRQGCS